jgi:hypothetical protein
MSNEANSGDSSEGRYLLRESAIMLFGLAFAAVNGFWTATVYGLSFGEYPLHIVALIFIGAFLTGLGLYLALRSLKRLFRRFF